MVQEEAKGGGISLADNKRTNMAQEQSAYALAGVDPGKITPFKEAMKRVALATASLPNARNVWVIGHACMHGGTWEYRGPTPVRFCETLEGLGNKNWLAELLYQLGMSTALQPYTGRTYYDWIAQCVVRMGTNDVIAQGALPVTYLDEVAAGDSDWFADEKRAEDFARGVQHACTTAGMALIGGESPSLRYLVRAREPVKSAPVLSGVATGVIYPLERTITGQKLCPGDQIIGIESSGPHANGYSLMIEEGLKLPDQFMTKLPSGKLLGEEMLKPTRCYVQAVEMMQACGVDIHALLPGTGDGVAKLAVDKRPFKYVVDFWPEVPELFEFFFERLLHRYNDPIRAKKECLSTFNEGVGYYAFVPKKQEDNCLMVLDKAGYPAWRLGEVKEGTRGTQFAPKGQGSIWLEPKDH